ncbi:FxsA family protein [Paracoccus spongiarum]|uniref:FxsA family protein n=1 Tax=Paracoccus spongiarum TaxID=3064387 RepID=A0ABT9JBI5_9RHOB|nr:FxsA family protein [Paracoccus sp. 2205BS29-5]MDP5306975.1 FxsA family protein [Paracoccus sp. 2205BS29-5]
MWLFWVFVAVPIIEIALFIQVGGWIGLWPTLAIVILTALVGTALMRSQGAHAWAEVQSSFNELRDPTRPLAHGVMILVAGMLLLTPGFFTDTMGLLLLIPAVRDAVMRHLARRIRITRVQMSASGMRRDPHRPPYGEGVIDGDYVVEDDPAPHGATRRPPDMADPDVADQSSAPRAGGSGWTRH